MSCKPKVLSVFYPQLYIYDQTGSLKCNRIPSKLPNFSVQISSTVSPDLEAVRHIHSFSPYRAFLFTNCDITIRNKS